MHRGDGMNAKPVHTTLAALTLAAVATIVTDARAEYRCDKPQGWVDARACAKAQEGPDVLRQYIHRTRMIYGLYFWDYVRPRDDVRRSKTARDAADRT
jgi:hypothetical protein